MSLVTTLTDYINAAFAGIWIETREPDEAEREIVKHAKEKKWRIVVWDVANGIRIPGSTDDAVPATLERIQPGLPAMAVLLLPLAGRYLVHRHRQS